MLLYIVTDLKVTVVTVIHSSADATARIGTVLKELL